MNIKNPFLRAIFTGLIVIAAVVIYAFGFQVTNVNFSEIRSERRQESLTRVLRALAQPDLVVYDMVETVVETPVRMPCIPGEEPPASAPVEPGDAYILLTPSCAEPRAEIQVQGFNFLANSQGPISFIPPSGVTLNMGTYRADAQGNFTLQVRLPARPNEQTQIVRAITRENVGAPRASQNAINTWNLIVETVFLALLATTFGVLMAVPVSFFAARNLMKDINATLGELALAIISWPLGMWFGGAISRNIGVYSRLLVGNTALTLVSLVVSGVVALLLARWALPQEEENIPGPRLRLARLAALLAAGVAAILGLFLLAEIAIRGGQAAVGTLGQADFLALFVENLGEILNLLISAAVAITGGALLSSAAGRLGKVVYANVGAQGRNLLNFGMGAAAGAVLFALLGAGLNWLYTINNPLLTLWGPAVTGALLGLLLAVYAIRRDILPVGLVVYYITRTLLNGLRAIEALIMVIVFVIWVGIGPFAGVLALSLHTIAALAKLYSEQVESVLPGPLEAVKATGATRLQSIIYAVIPQIIPPYISFTMYRWDINVRMSTIIGFAGGGGIGFLLIQNINLLNYRAASAQMLAIAVVVGLMDFLSSYLREKVV